MRIASSAASAVLLEAERWLELAGDWVPARHLDLWGDLPATEADVVRYFEPEHDLQRRARYWGYELGTRDLSDLCRFGAALAQVEADAWEGDQPHIATRAYADRRFLLGDRLLHWAVPWLNEAARCYPSEGGLANRSQLTLLELGDQLRPAPALSEGTEGLFAPGEDSYGTLGNPAPLHDFILSVWSGRVVMGATLHDLTGSRFGERVVDPTTLASGELATSLQAIFSESATGWRQMAAEHPGSARLWLDMAERASATARLLGRSSR